MGYSFVLTAIIGLAIKYTIGFRVSDEAEAEGVDENEHAETAYDFSSLRTGGGGLGTPRPDADTARAAEHVPATAGSAAGSSAGKEG